MLKLLITVLLAAGALGCGVPTYAPNSRVVNGEDARPHSWPWQISLQYQGGADTASHPASRIPLRSESGRTYQVVLGEHDRGTPEGREQIVPVNKGDIFVHEGWKSSSVSNGNDIALIKLSRVALLTDEVQLACLPPAGELLPNQHPCYISGWGRLT
ncbi:PREDICTED: chymotrypsin-like elastase family member 3B, partial [Nanorana parkeri]|uniref:chymotrypsin-like elastase family member 3B n=1 Tax=Nanorana parkeri TaxID=125878 RepID=UPI0008548BAD